MNTSDEELPIEIDVKAVKAMLDTGEECLLVDCREQDEWDFVHIEQAKHLPMGETLTRVGELESHRDRRIVVHCHHGGRSLQVVQWLRGQGYGKSQNMTGGIDAWSCDVDPSLPRY